MSLDCLAAALMTSSHGGCWVWSSDGGGVANRRSLEMPWIVDSSALRRATAIIAVLITNFSTVKRVKVTRPQQPRCLHSSVSPSLQVILRLLHTQSTLRQQVTKGNNGGSSSCCSAGKASAQHLLQRLTWAAMRRPGGTTPVPATCPWATSSTMGGAQGRHQRQHCQKQPGINDGGLGFL
jgi:hypothetical protein